eukprot:COSAG05_NODE_5676_length_1117_cov_60.315324_1_plen_69_part_00
MPGGFEESRVTAMKQLYPALRAALPPLRRHLVPASCPHFVSRYEDQWDETFIEATPSEQLRNLRQHKL